MCGLIDSFSVCRYLDLRGLSNGVGPVRWPAAYGPAERDEAYKSFSLSGWAGRSGHDAPMIALDALLGAGSDWEELMSRAGFHGGQTVVSQKSNMAGSVVQLGSFEGHDSGQSRDRVKLGLAVWLGSVQVRVSGAV